MRRLGAKKGGAAGASFNRESVGRFLYCLKGTNELYAWSRNSLDSSTSRNLLQINGHGCLLMVADYSKDNSSFLLLGQLISEIRYAVDLAVVYRDDDVTGSQASLGRGRVSGYLGYQNAMAFLDPKEASELITNRLSRDP